MKVFIYEWNHNTYKSFYGEGKIIHVNMNKNYDVKFSVYKGLHNIVFNVYKAKIDLIDLKK